jgi:hypothetical protein
MVNRRSKHYRDWTTVNPQRMLCYRITSRLAGDTPTVDKAKAISGSCLCARY